MRPTNPLHLMEKRNLLAFAGAVLLGLSTLVGTAPTASATGLPGPSLPGAGDVIDGGQRLRGVR